MLRISYPPMRVYVDGVRMQPKVAPVLALMAVRAKQYPPEQAWVSAAEVALLPDWSSSKSKSVGTEVYNALRRLGLQKSGLVESPHLGKVTKWRFRASIEVNWQPDFDSVANALAADTGRIAATQSAASLIVEPSAKSRVLADEFTRLRFTARSRIDSDDVLKRLIESNPFWDLMEQPDDQTRLNRARSLARQATLLLQKGDSSTAATLFNTAGCIANAENAFADGKRWLLTAIPLLLAHGALVELEAALFNLSANCSHREDQCSTVLMAANSNAAAPRSQIRTENAGLSSSFPRAFGGNPVG